MQTTIIEGVKYYFIDDIQEEASDIQLHKMHGTFTYNISFFIAGFGVRRIYLTLTGNWQIVGKADSLTESDWDKIVEKVIPSKNDELKLQIYKSYHGESMPYCWAKNSGLSLLSSLNLNPKTTIVLKET